MLWVVYFFCIVNFGQCTCKAAVGLLQHGSKAASYFENSLLWKSLSDACKDYVGQLQEACTKLLKKYNSGKYGVINMSKGYYVAAQWFIKHFSVFFCLFFFFVLFTLLFVFVILFTFVYLLDIVFLCVSCLCIDLFTL